MHDATGIPTSYMDGAINISDDILAHGPIEIIYGAIFKKLDFDQTNLIDYNEFVELCKYLGLNLDKEKSLEIFSQAIEDGKSMIDPHGFRMVMNLVIQEVIFVTLKRQGLTYEDLIWIGIMSFLFLLLLLILIFLGVEAFSQAFGFNAVINSILPLAAGALTAAKDWDIQSSVEKVKEFVKSTISKFKSTA